MTINHGMNIEEIEHFGNRLQTHMAEEIRRVAREIETVIGQSTQSWVGPDAERFRSWWPDKRTLINTTADDVYGFGQAALNNASEQRLASGEPVPGAARHGRTGTGPDPFAVRTESSARETKSGAVVRGVDGSEFILREMSDGTVQVQMIFGDGLEADIGDAVELAKIARGDFFSGEGIEWDLDASLMKEASTTYTFTDPDSARLFFEALKDKQDGFMSITGGMNFGDVREVINDLEGQLEGEVSFSGYDGGYRFSAEGSFGVKIGDGVGVGGEIGMGRVVGNTVETVASDGSTGELNSMSGYFEGGGSIEVGPNSFEVAAGEVYNREVHLIRNADGVPVRLEVTESFGVKAELGVGRRFLGTGGGVEASLTNQVVNSQVFDLTDPSVAASFGGDTGSSELFNWAKSNAELGGQTVTTYAGNDVSTSASLLFSGEWNTIDGSAEIQSVSHRAPGGSFTTQDLQPPEGFENRQFIEDENGNPQMVYTGSF